MKYIKNIVNWILERKGFTLLSLSNYKSLVQKKELADEYLFLQNYPPSQFEDFLKIKELSKSQLGQELFVLMELNFKRNGFFVEFGATNGLSLNNTYVLEKEFEWSGILAEPSKFWHKELYSNRKVHIDTRCVWKDSKQKIMFKEVDNPSLSTIKGFGEDDTHSERRLRNKTYEVETISLLDLLDYYKAPQIIDFLSVDTEGSEFVILENFDFSKYKFRTITVEHNFSNNREKIYSLLTAAGYERVLEEFSMYDDWYKLKKIP